MKLNYPELRGTEIIITREYLLPIKCTVIGVEYHKGITIVDSLDPEIIRVCLPREGYVKNKTLTKYRHRFQSLITYIHRGRASRTELCNLFSIDSGYNSLPSAICPFSK